MGNKKWIKKRSWILGITVILVLGAFVLIGGIFDVTAQEGTPSDYEHTISFTQRELAAMLEQNFNDFSEEESELDSNEELELEDIELEDSEEDEDESEEITYDLKFDMAKLMELSESFIPNAGAFEEWLEEALDGLIPMGEIIEADEYFGFLAMDVEARELHFMAFNTSDENRGFELEISDKDKAPARSEVYAFVGDGEFEQSSRDDDVEVNEEDDKDATDESDNSEESNNSTDDIDEELDENDSEDTDGEDVADSNDEEDIAGNDSEDVDNSDDSADESPDLMMKVAPRSFASILVDTVEDDSTDEVETEEVEIDTEAQVDEPEADFEEDDDDDEEFEDGEYSVELQRSFSNPRSEGSYKMVLKPGEFGRIILRTGLLNGGTIGSQGEIIEEESENPVLADGIQSSPMVVNSLTLDDVGLATGGSSGSGTSAGSKSVLKIYSQADSEALEIEAESDFVIYSKKPGLYYEINEDSVINVSGTSATNRYFYIELHNSRAVTIKQYNLTTGTVRATTTTYISAETDRAVLNIENEDGDAIYFAGALELDGTGEISAHSGSGYAVRKISNSNYVGGLTLKNDFALRISGTNGIDVGSTISISDGSGISIDNLETTVDGKVLSSAGAITLTDSDIHLNNIVANGANPITTGAITLTESYLTIRNVKAMEDGNILSIGALSAKNNSAVIIENVNSDNSGHALAISGAMTFENSELIVDYVNVGSDLVYVTGALTQKHSSMGIFHSKAGGNGFRINGNINLTNESDLAVETVTIGGDLIYSGGTFSQSDATINIAECQTTGNGLWMNGNATVTNSVWGVYETNVGGSLIHGNGTFAPTTVEFDILNSQAAGSGLRINGAVTVNNFNANIKDSLIDDYAVNFAGGVNSSTTALRVQNSEFNIAMGESKGGALYFGGTRTPVLDTSKVTLSANANEKVLFYVAGGLDIGRSAAGSATPVELTLGEKSTGGGLRTSALTMYQDSSIKIDKKGLDGYGISAAGILTMHNTAKITLVDNGKAGDSILVNSNLVMNNNAEITIESKESTGNNLAVSGNITLANDTKVTIKDEGDTGNNISATGNVSLTANAQINIENKGTEGNNLSARALTLASATKITIKDDGSSGHNILASGAVTLGGTSSIAIEDNGSGGHSVSSTSNLILNDSSQINIKRTGTSEDDSISIGGAATLNSKSNITVDNESTTSRNMYVKGNVTLNTEASMKHTSELVGKAGDIGAASEWDVDPDDEDDEEDYEEPDEPNEPTPEPTPTPGDGEEEDGDDEGDGGDSDDDDIIYANPELDRYLGDTQAVVFIKGNLILSHAGTSVEVYGNADKKSNDVEGTPYGLIMHGAESQILNGAYIKVDNVRIGLLAQTLRLEYSRGDKTYDTVETIFSNTAKSRVYARGTYIGVLCTNYFRVLSSSNLYAEGGSAGVVARRTSAIQIGYGARAGSTVISLGMNAGSSGFVLTEDMRFFGGMRVIAEGEENGILLTKKSSRLLIRYGTELIAVGRSDTSSGVYSENENATTGTIRASGGSHFYAIGGMNGIYALNTNVLSLGSSNARYTTMIGIGGVPDEYLTHSLTDMDYLNKPFDVTDLPYPVLAEGNRGDKIYSEDEIEVPGVVQGGREGSRGIVTGGSREPWIQARNYSTMIGIGGEYGVANTGIALNDNDSSSGGQIWARYGRISGHGGSIGVWSSTRVRTTNKGSLWGYGEDYGVYASTTLRSYGGGSANHGYMYGIGKINGLHSDKGFESYNYGHFIGETWIDPVAGPEEAMGSPAIKSLNKRDAMYVRNYGLLHEVYNTIGMVFTSPDPYQLNVEFDAVGQNMGANPQDIAKYTWTTPIIEEATSNEWSERFYTQYDVNNDQRLLYAGQGLNTQGELQYGLISTGYEKGTTIVANRYGLDTLANASGSVYGTARATHRMTFRSASTLDVRTMKVQVDLREIIGSNNYDVNNLPAGLSFELDFTPQFTDGYDEEELPVKIIIDDLDEYHYDRETGMLTFYKLRLGDYVLRAVNQYGWPYQDIPEVPFTVIVDTRNNANGPGGLTSNWTNDKWLETVYMGYYEEQEDGTRKWHNLDANIAKTSVAQSKLTPPDDSAPTFTPPEGPTGAPAEEQYVNFFAKPSNFMAEIQVYYHRIQYELDLRPVDSQNHQTLGYGRFNYTGYLENGNNDVSVLTGTFNNGTNNYVSADAYQNQIMYAGLKYNIVMNRHQSYYTDRYDAHELRLMYDTEAGVHYIEDVGEPNFSEYYYSYVTEGEDVVYHTLVLHDYTRYTSRKVTINLVDADDITLLLENGEFELHTQLSGGTTDFSRDNSLVANGDGTFTFDGRRNASYRLYQTGTNSGYRIHDGYYAFSLTNNDAQTITRGTHQVTTIEGSNGWVSPTSNGTAGPIIISNISNQGELKVRIDAQGIWSGHDDAIFVIELKGIDENGNNRVFYNNARLLGNTEFDDYGYKNQTKSETVVFEDIPRGEYQITVYSSLRTGNGTSQIRSGSASRRGTGEALVFSFENQSEHLLSGADFISHEYTIQFE